MAASEKIKWPCYTIRGGFSTHLEILDGVRVECFEEKYGWRIPEIPEIKVDPPAPEFEVREWVCPQGVLFRDHPWGQPVFQPSPKKGGGAACTILFDTGAWWHSRVNPEQNGEVWGKLDLNPGMYPADPPYTLASLCERFPAESCVRGVRRGKPRMVVRAVMASIPIGLHVYLADVDNHVWWVYHNGREFSHFPVTPGEFRKYLEDCLGWLRRESSDSQESYVRIAHNLSVLTRHGY